MRRASLSLSFLIASLLLASACSQPQPERKLPADVLLLTFDTTRPDDLGCYGGLASTPNLDTLADDALVFESLFSVGFGTSPSHASLFSSKHPAEHGVHDNATPLAPRFVTLSEVLKSSGYRTAAFIGAAPLRSRLGFEQGFEHFDESFLEEASERRAADTVEAYLDWSSKSGDDRPSFSWIHLYDPHQPYDPPGAFAPADSDPELRALFYDAKGLPRFLFPEDLQDLPESSIEEVDRIARSRYRGEISYLDSQVGRILDALEDRGSYGETIILATSDHGESFLEDGLDVAFRHQELRSSVSRLVGILKLPENRLGGMRVLDLVGNIDLGPTLLDLLDVPGGEEWAGRSVLPSLDAEGRPVKPVRDSLVLEGSDPQLVAIRKLKWAYVEPRPGAFLDPALPAASIHQLYDLEADPLERINVVDRHPEIVARLRREVRDFLASKAVESVPALDDESHREALRSLGYLE